MALATGSERARRHVAGALIAAALIAATRPARADVTAADKATAEALFEHGKGLMKEGHFGEACSKFQESQRIDPGLGTMLYLADCFEKNGQTASAWGQFLEAVAAAKTAGQADREKKARDRASALEGRLNRLSITILPGADVVGFEVKRDGVVVTKATFGTALPLDPGEHTIEAAAPGKKPWSTKVRIDQANLASVSLVVPVLEDAPRPATEPSKGEPLPARPPEPSRFLINEPGRPAPRAQAPPLIARETSSPARVVGGVLLGVGLGVVGVGGILGTLALLKNSEAEPNCHVNNWCTPAGADARNAALGLATDANITIVAGAAAFTTGLVLLLATKAPSTDKQVFQVGPMIGAGTGGLSIRAGF